MDPELFKKKLEEFAELKLAKTPKSPAIRENDEPEVIYRGGKEFTVESDTNSTLTYIIKKMKPHVAVCEDCDKVVENRVLEIKQHQMPTPHWRRSCKNCMKTQNPYTGEFDLTSTKSFHVMNCWIKGSPQPQTSNDIDENQPDLKPVFKKPTK
jgi:hypothetical protein